jgi:hypothetical protein
MLSTTARERGTMNVGADWNQSAQSSARQLGVGEPSSRPPVCSRRGRTLLMDPAQCLAHRFHNPVRQGAAVLVLRPSSPTRSGHAVSGTDVPGVPVPTGLAAITLQAQALPLWLPRGSRGHLGWDDDRVAESRPREAGRSWGHRAFLAEDELTHVDVRGPGFTTAEGHRRGPRWTGPAAKTRCPTRWSTPRSGSGPPRWKHRRSPFRSSTRSRTSWGRGSPDGSDRC